VVEVKKAKLGQSPLSKRESQIMEVIYASGKATANDVHENIDDAPSYSTIRALLRILLDKGHLKYEKEGLRYVYYPTCPREVASSSALKKIITTFFEGSIEKTVAALLDNSDKQLSKAQLDAMAEMIDQARSKGAKND